MDVPARGRSLAAFDGRRIASTPTWLPRWGPRPAGGVAPRSSTHGILVGRRALPTGRLARLGATPDLHHGLVRTALLLLRGYKIFVSPMYRGSCRFLPSCADYAAEAVTRHGLVRGGWLAARRLARCHPLCAAGHDPVPVKP